MKILVCTKKHCHSNKSEELLKSLEDSNVEFTHSACMHMCDDGPNVFTFPDLKMYGHVDKSRLQDIISGNSDGLEYDDEIYNLEINKQYSLDPMHKRTVKLFRWHLAKHDDISVRGIERMIGTFMKKYDVEGIDFSYPIKVALIKTIKGPDLPKLINYLGKNSTMILFDEFLKKGNQ